MLSCAWLAALILTLYFTESEQRSCLTRQDALLPDTTARSLGATFYLDRNNPFTCYGIVTHFTFCFKASAGALSDTVYIGVYKPDSDGDRYTRIGYNGIRIKPLPKKGCFTYPAHPQIIVDEGYVLAFYVTFAYFKLFENSTNGYLYKSVGFPNSISTGVLIRTSKPYVPKLEAIVSKLSTCSIIIIHF